MYNYKKKLITFLFFHDLVQEDPFWLILDKAPTEITRKGIQDRAFWVFCCSEKIHEVNTMWSSSKW